MFLLNFVDAKLGKRWKKNETEGKRNYRGIQGPLDHPDLIVIFFFPSRTLGRGCMVARLHGHQSSLRATLSGSWMSRVLV